MDLASLRAFVTAADAQRYQGLPAGMVMVTVSHVHLTQRWPDIRVDLSTSVGALKERLYRHGGTPASMQRLELLLPGSKHAVVMADDARPVGFYSPVNGSEIRIVDLDPHSLARGGWLENTALVEKWEMPDDVYDKRENTVRKQKAAKEKARKEAAEAAVANAAPPPIPPTHKVGARCQVGPGARRGEIKFVGLVPGLGASPEEDAATVWVGVALDEPLGRNDGTVNGKRLFSCPPKHGVLAKLDRVDVGDFPPRDPLASDEDEDQDQDEEV